MGKKEKAVKERKDGSLSVSSKSGVLYAIDRIEEIDAEIAAEVAPLQDERDKLKAAVDEYVLEHEAIETPKYKLTRTQSHTRTWDIDKLMKLIPRGVLKNVVKMTVDSAKLDQAVRAGKIDRKKIEPAFEERPNAAYVKWTKKSDKSGKAAEEAESLAEAMG